MFFRKAPIALSLFLSLSLPAGYAVGTAVPKAPAKIEVKSADVRDGVRLPGNCSPEHYDLYFEPNFEASEFEGTETVLINVSATTRTITMNAVDLSVFEAGIASKAASHGDYQKAEIGRDNAKQLLTLTFAKPLSPGRYELNLKFSGKLSEKLEGFYLSTFKDARGKEHKLATTQMEPTDARRMFPSFDEPSYKAVFRLTAAIPTNMTAVSNAAVEFEKIDQRKDKKLITFKNTAPMSTYLVTLIVGELKASPEITVNGKKIRVLCVPGKENLTAYALNVAAKLLPYYENYFGIAYPFDKLDLIAIPDFSAGAMENFGAITFRETALLVDEKTASTKSKMNVTNIIAHEMAHLWFGDLVTMKWWNDLWLNEAFATWMANKASDVLEPGWRVWDDFAFDRTRALFSDSLRATRAVEYPVRTPEDAMEMFDEITYEKGGSLLRMLETYLGEDEFQKGIKRYMKEHAFANATTDDLWQALTAENKDKVDVSKLMQNWVFAKGAPIVSFKESEAKGSRSRIELKQERFYLDGKGDLKQSEKDILWQIPVILKGQALSARHLLVKALESYEVGGSGVYFVNGAGNGFFRTRYSEAQIDRLGKNNLLASLSVKERLSFYSDLHALCLGNQISIKKYLSVLSEAREEDPYVLSLLAGSIGELEAFVDADNKKEYAALVQKTLKGPLSKLGYQRKPGESPLESELRGSLIRMLGTIGEDSEAIEFCRSKFDLYLSEDKDLDADLLSPIVTVVAYNGDPDDYARITQSWKLASTPEATERNLVSLANFRQPDLVANTLEMILRKDVRSQDGPRQLGKLLSSPWSKTQAWKFVKENWLQLEKKFQDKRMSRIIDACSYFSTGEELAELGAFIESHPLPAGRRSQAKALEIVALRAKFRSEQGKLLNQELKQELKQEQKQEPKQEPRPESRARK